MKTKAQQQSILESTTSGLSAPRLVAILGKKCTVNASTDVITSAGHGYSNGDEICVSAESMPGGLANTAVYYVRDVTTDTFKVAATSGGAAIDITSAGTNVAVTKLDPADPATWAEVGDLATTNRPSLAGLFGTVTEDDAANIMSRTWPTSDQEYTLASGAVVVRLGIADDTGAIGTAGRRIADSGFYADVPAGGKLRVAANSQTSSEK